MSLPAMPPSLAAGAGFLLSLWGLWGILVYFADPEPRRIPGLTEFLQEKMRRAELFARLCAALSGGLLLAAVF